MNIIKKFVIKITPSFFPRIDPIKLVSSDSSSSDIFPVPITHVKLIPRSANKLLQTRRQTIVFKRDQSKNYDNYSSL